MMSCCGGGWLARLLPRRFAPLVMLIYDLLAPCALFARAGLCGLWVERLMDPDRGQLIRVAGSYTPYGIAALAKALRVNRTLSALCRVAPPAVLPRLRRKSRRGCGAVAHWPSAAGCGSAPLAPRL